MRQIKRLKACVCTHYAHCQNETNENTASELWSGWKWMSQCWHQEEGWEGVQPTGFHKYMHEWTIGHVWSVWRQAWTNQTTWASKLTFGPDQTCPQCFRILRLFLDNSQSHWQGIIQVVATLALQPNLFIPSVLSFFSFSNLALWLVWNDDALY